MRKDNELLKEFIEHKESEMVIALKWVIVGWTFAACILSFFC